MTEPDRRDQMWATIDDLKRQLAEAREERVKVADWCHTVYLEIDTHANGWRKRQRHCGQAAESSTDDRGTAAHEEAMALGERVEAAEQIREAIEMLDGWNGDEGPSNQTALIERLRAADRQLAESQARERVLREAAEDMDEPVPRGAQWVRLQRVLDKTPDSSALDALLAAERADGIDEERHAVIDEVCQAFQDGGCVMCGKPAVCFGFREGFVLSCGTCCGHGDEDGWCEDLPRPDALLADKESSYERRIRVRVALARETERERCARVCDDLHDEYCRPEVLGASEISLARDCAEAIRARRDEVHSEPSVKQAAKTQAQGEMSSKGDEVKDG